MLIGKFPQKVDRSGIARFFPVKSFSKKDSTFNYFLKKKYKIKAKDYRWMKNIIAEKVLMFDQSNCLPWTQHTVAPHWETA